MTTTGDTERGGIMAALRDASSFNGKRWGAEKTTVNSTDQGGHGILVAPGWREVGSSIGSDKGLERQRKKSKVGNGKMATGGIFK